jgi:small-conductance mechanosensitive channel
MRAMQDLTPSLQSLWQHPLFSLGSARITVGGLVQAVIFVVIIWVLAGLLERAAQRMAKRHADEPWMFARIHMFSRLTRYGVWVIGSLMGLNYLGIDLTNIALLGSALAVGLGFGLQNIVSNFVSGVIILLERSLKVGDFVELESGVRGHVREIAMRYTRVTTNDALDVLVPNSEFINGRMVNWTFDDSFRRMHVPFGVAYGTPKELVREAGIAAAKAVDGVVHNDKMKTAVWLVEYGDNSVNYELIVWADRALTTRPASTHAALMWALDDQLHQRGIEIPFPQRDLHIRSGTLSVRMADTGTIAPTQDNP